MGYTVSNRIPEIIIGCFIKPLMKGRQNGLLYVIN